MKQRWIGLGLLLGLSVYGCSADSDSGWIAKDKGTSAPAAGGEGKAQSAVSTVNVKGQSAIDGANSVVVTKMGDTTPIATGTVNPDGTFQVDVPQSETGDTSDGGLLVMSLKNLVGAVVGSAVLNGIPAFAKGFLVQAPLDAVTSYKTEVLSTIQKKGTPGVQNYLNVVDAYVDANLSGVLATTGAFESDASNLLGATSDAIIATEKVISDSFKAAGIPLDLGILEKGQATVVSGIQGQLLDANGKFSTGAKNLIASLEAAAAKGAAPIDQLIFNAVVNGGATFSDTFKKKTGNTAPKANFAASKSVFNLQTTVATSKIRQQLSGGDADSMTKLEQACTDFLAAGSSATKIEDFEVARQAFSDLLMGKNSGGGLSLPPLFAKLAAVATQVVATLAPIAIEIEHCLTGQYDSKTFGSTLTKVDNADLPSSLGDVFRFVQKDVVL